MIFKTALRGVFRHSGRVALCLLPFIINFLIRGRDLRFYHADAYAVDYLCLGGLDLSKGIGDILNFLFYTISFVFVIYVFSDYARADFIISCTYVFTRMGKREKWFDRFALRLLRAVCAFFLAAAIIGAVIGCAFGLKAPNGAEIVAMLLMALLCSLSVYAFSLFQNMLSLRMGSAFSFLIAMAIYVFSLLAAMLLFGKGEAAEKAIWLLLPSGQMYVIHADGVRAGLGGFEGYPAAGSFYLAFSVAALALCSVLVYAVSRLFIKRGDLTELIMED